MEAVLALLANSADQSQILQQIGQEGLDGGDLPLDGEEEWGGSEMHNGKQYSKVMIQGLGEEEKYYMDEESGDIYDLKF